MAYEVTTPLPSILFLLIDPFNFIYAFYLFVRIFWVLPQLSIGLVFFGYGCRFIGDLWMDLISMNKYMVFHRLIVLRRKVFHFQYLFDYLKLSLRGVTYLCASVVIHFYVLRSFQIYARRSSSRTSGSIYFKSLFLRFPPDYSVSYLPFSICVSSLGSITTVGGLSTLLVFSVVGSFSASIRRVGSFRTTMS